MNKSSESALITGSGIAADEIVGAETRSDATATVTTRSLELSRPYNISRSDFFGGKGGEEQGSDGKKDEQKFAMIFNKYNSNKLNLRPSQKSAEDGKSKDKNDYNKYTMIFNKDVTIRSKTDVRRGEETKSSTSLPLREIEAEQSSVRLNDAETLMTLYGRSSLFIPELTINSLMSEVSDSSRRRKCSDPGLRMYNSLTALPKAKPNRRVGDGQLKCKIASLTSLESHATRDVQRKHVSVMQERKLFRVRSLDWSESLSSSESDGSGFQREAVRRAKESESPPKGDKKSWGDGTRKGEKDGSGCRKQVQWKTEVDVIYFESHQAADGDSRSGEILGRVMEPLREEWEQQRSGFYAKMVPLPLGNHFNERWQSLLKI